jgi:regulator of cell morphogenesis and NO signaling
MGAAVIECCYAASCTRLASTIKIVERMSTDLTFHPCEMRRLTNAFIPPDDACNTFRVLYRQMEELESDLHIHIHLENNILFPRAAELERRY